jgi:lysophospholipase L1-like esterase
MIKLSHRLRAGLARRLARVAAALEPWADAGSGRESIANTATTPVSGDPAWHKLHAGFLEIARAGNVDLLFLGDSITNNWRNRESDLWSRYYGRRRAANFGINGDRIQHLLWRLHNGELEGIQPRVVVLLIGTNNVGREAYGVWRNTNAEVIAGVKAVVACLRTKLPNTKILLLALFPRGTFDSPERARVALINTVIAKLNDDRTVRFLDIGPRFLDADGLLPEAVMPDLLHLTEKGYEIWADAMEPTLADMLK